MATWNSRASEVFWCAYAWPVNTEETGNRVFFINQENEVAAYHNRDAVYDGLQAGPDYGAAFNAATTANSIDQGIAYSKTGLVGNDGQSWVTIGQ